MNNRETLMTLMQEYALERREIAELLSVHREEVDHWLISSESTKHVEIPDMAIELLQLKLAAGKSTADDGS
jgi:tRNA isopentenyl-2-thiomethyl-A-37 hydroxylase MiaE